jgi:uncharacterized protein (TIGR00297 family)
MINQIVLALIFSGLIAALAYWRGSLAVSGALGALLVGTIIYGFGGWVWGVVLALFFVSSSLLSHYKEREKRAVAEKFDKGHRRDIGQVLANGGAGALVALLHGIFPSPLWLPLFLGTMATVTADTWATELGTLSKRPPRLITTGRVVPVGTSGGISLFGTAVSFVGGCSLAWQLDCFYKTRLSGSPSRRHRWADWLPVRQLFRRHGAANLLLRPVPERDRKEAALRPAHTAVARLALDEQ